MILQATMDRSTMPTTLILLLRIIIPLTELKKPFWTFFIQFSQHNTYLSTLQTIYYNSRWPSTLCNTSFNQKDSRIEYAQYSDYLQHPCKPTLKNKYIHRLTWVTTHQCYSIIYSTSYWCSNDFYYYEINFKKN